MRQEVTPGARAPRLYYGWIVALACLPITMVNGGVFFSFGIFFKPIAADFAWSRGQVSLVYTALLLSYAPGAILSGRVADRYGPRGVLVATGVLMGARLVSGSQAQGLGWLLLSYSLVGLGVSATLVVPSAVVQRWFMRRRGLALGAVAGGVGFGTMVFSPLAHFLVSSYGWRSALLVLGIVLGAMVVAGASVMLHGPEKKGLRAFGAESDSTVRVALPTAPRRNMTTAQAIRTATFAKLMAINIISQLPGYFLLTHLVPYATDRGISPGAAAGAMGLMGLFNVLGRITLGAMAERTGWMKALSLSAFACVLTTLWLMGVSELWMLYVYVMAYGFFWGGRLPPLMGSVGYFFGTASLAELIGITLASSLVVGASAPFVAGLVFDRTGSYFPVLIASVV
ncbi:MAG: MFS transporter, partial [Dehalococcoidia bacterium]|nr:MFS transporter [Dehalococcoidia bacterium]